MAPSAQSFRLHAERRLARHYSAKRSLLFERDPSDSNSQPPVATLPHGTATLVGIVVVLSCFVLCFAAWRIYVYRSKKNAADSRRSQHEGLYDAVEEEIKRRSSNSSEVAIPQPAMTRERNPAEIRINLGYEPKVMYVAPPQKISSKAPPSTLQIKPPVDFDGPKALISPRTIASIAPKLPPMPSARLPRLVVVESSFQTTLHDELTIKVGETLRLLEEYEDEWCLVQRVGSRNAEKGVVPRFCVVDKPDMPSTRRGAHVPQLSSSSIMI
ncbi:hypothetical protein M422DRAFT_252311 [Sphaerobolus stellatus SS14]|uniref:SH3 domain-containing protein n=1 Tax=Sphaerobolus stellatus (strain SS14) TaxID=990650 RepID=A0A0C9VBF9_SPHS4|nr:hypothetical protein M422DRAFT_252311 [Sphaerobolus stellatus SS14]